MLPASQLESTLFNLLVKYGPWQQMNRDALEKINRRVNEMAPVATDALMAAPMCSTRGAITSFVLSSCTGGGKSMGRIRSKVGKCFRINLALHVGA